MSPKSILALLASMPFLAFAQNSSQLSNSNTVSNTVSQFAPNAPFQTLSTGLGEVRKNNGARPTANPTMLPTLGSKKLQGGVAGGGGSRLESAFRLTATELIKKVSDNSVADSLCPATVMLQGLNSSKISVVNQLTNLNTGQPVRNNQLEAWTKPGSIQLQKEAWDKYLDNGYLIRSVRALVLHEVYRTTNCDDDTGTLSTEVVKLLEGETDSKSTKKYKKLFAMKYPAPLFDYHKLYKGNPAIEVLMAFCDKNIINEQVFPANVVCVAVANSKNPSDKNSHTHAWILKTTGVGQDVIEVKVAPSYSTSTAADIFKIRTFINEETPFYILADLEQMDFYYGMSLSNLNRF